MGAFDHIILLLSFVYALAIAHLLTTVAMLIRQSARVRFSALHAAWMWNALMVIMANWIGFWDMRTLPDWTVATIFFTFGMAFVNYLQAALVCPEVIAGEALDLVEFQARERRRILGSAAGSCVLAALANFVYGSAFGVISWNAANLAVVPMAVATLAATVWRWRWLQVGAAVTTLGLWAFYFIAVQAAVR